MSQERPPSISEQAWLALPVPQRDAIARRAEWLKTARPAQLPPQTDWLVWFLCSGRGAGKTRTSTEDAWWYGMANTEHRIALVAPTFSDARDVYIEGESGLLNCLPKSCLQTWNRSLGELVLTNGTRYKAFSAEEPESLRGPQFHRAYCDELGRWRYQQETWDQLMFGLRLGAKPQVVITTTPRPTPLIKQLLKDPKTHVTRESTFANSANLSALALQKLKDQYAGTRLGRQELEAEVLDDAPGALWRRSQLDEIRVNSKLPDMQRIVVGVDPATKERSSSDDDGGAETGIVVAGLGVDGLAYVLADYSLKANPEGWAKRAISAIDRFEGDCIVAETNQGGAMVRSTIRAVRATVKVIPVHAARGKVTRAEPISALYEQNRVRHVGSLPELEDQMVTFTTQGIEGDTTGDRVDALVWALTELFPRMTKKRIRSQDLKVEGIENYNPHQH